MGDGGQCDQGLLVETPVVEKPWRDICAAHGEVAIEADGLHHDPVSQQEAGNQATFGGHGLGGLTRGKDVGEVTQQFQAGALAFLRVELGRHDIPVSHHGG